MTVPAPSVPAPIAERRPITRTHHGDDFVDDYEWLRDKEDPATLAYLEAENAHTDAATEHLEPLRQQIFDEIKSRTLETDLSVPTRHGAWWYYARTLEGQQYAIRARCAVTDADDWTPPELSADSAIPGEQILLDSNVEAEGHEFFSLGAFSVSDDENFLAWSVDTQGDERYTIRVKDLRTGEVLPDEIAGASGGATWSADGTHLFYTTVDDAWRPFRVWRHALGTSGEDVLVHEEGDERYFIGVGRTQSEKYLVIGMSSKITSEYRVLEADDPQGEFRVVLPRRDGVEYSLEHAVVAGEDRFVILHNEDALNFELVTVPVDAPTERTVVLAGSDTTRLEDVDVFARHLVVSYRRDALARIGTIAIGDHGLGPLQEIDFGEELFTSGVGANAEWDPPLIRVGVGSFVTPSSVYDFDPATRELILRKQAPVLGGYDADDYEQHRSWAVADDGATARRRR
jgi:oligopeptidase B